MQLIWVSGPVGQIRTFNVTFKNVLLTLLGLILSFIVLGALLQFVGFRWAIEYSPAIAKSLGNVHSGFEIDNLNYFYRSKLNEIQLKQQQINDKLLDLEEKNKALTKLVTPNVKFKEHLTEKDIGGAFLPKNLESNKSLLDVMNLTLGQMSLSQKRIEKSNQVWGQYYDDLASTPISIPVSFVSLSSGFGVRSDPLNNYLSDHTGLDFQGPIGMPIFAAGDGKIISTGWDNAYGLTVQIEHMNGLVSKYAHASKILVSEGQDIKAGEKIALIGNTGRSTGPHLHFEIIKSGTPVNPKDYLVGLNPGSLR
jgi:murein DD-endopeptidase MepM/ murein hydrolase activator NlpD